jgi:hypothetical protein
VPPSEAEAAAPRQVLRCEDCNAAMAYSAQHQNPACGFCGAVMRVEEPVDPVEEPQGRVAMAVNKDAAKQSLQQWLSTRGFFRPTKLAAESTVDSVHPLWWAAWVCDVDARVSWTADSNQGSRRSDWAPHSGQLTMKRRNLLISASRGLTKDETRALTPHYDLRALEDLPADARAVEQFDAQRSAARALVADAIEAEAVAEVKNGHIPGSRYRKVSAHAMMVGLTTRRLALPAWVVVYKFQNKPYRAVVHGQDAAVVVGSSPISVWKVLGVVFGAVALLGLIIALVQFFSRH